MLTVGALITVFCKVKLGDIASTSVFKSGMVACICVLGVAWLGDTFVSGHTAQIKAFASETISQYPALLAVVFFLAAMLLYSQAATAKAITPTVVAALGITAAHPGQRLHAGCLLRRWFPLCSFSRHTRHSSALFRWTTPVQHASVSGSSITLSSSPAFWRFSSPSLSVSLSVASCNPLI